MADFNHFSEEMQKLLKAAETGMEKAVVKFEADTKLLTHVDTGTLRRSWTHKTTAYNNGNIEVAVGSNVEYTPIEDSYHPNISQALEDNIDSYLLTISNEIQKQIGW